MSRSMSFEPRLDTEKLVVSRELPIHAFANYLLDTAGINENRISSEPIHFRRNEILLSDLLKRGGSIFPLSGTESAHPSDSKS